MRRAAVSAASNLVEGCGRFSERDYVRFVDMACGSAREVEYQLSLAIRLGYLAEKEADEVVEIAAETNRVMAGLQQSLRRSPDDRS
jgi:four helix bundle protein